MEKPVLPISNLYAKFESCVSELEERLETATAERDMAVQYAATALDNYEKSIATTDDLLRALKQIAVICPSISNRIEV